MGGGAGGGRRHGPARLEPRERVLADVGGLLAPLERKNSGTLAERAGEASPERDVVVVDERGLGCRCGAK